MSERKPATDRDDTGSQGLTDGYTENLDRYSEMDEQMLPLLNGSSVRSTDDFRRLVRRGIGVEASHAAIFWIASAQQRGEVVRDCNGTYRMTEPDWMKTAKPDNGFDPFEDSFPASSRLERVARRARSL